MAKLLAACLALAALSLLLPSQPSYDPFAWLVSGREIAHGQLDTTGGSSWKPLPVVFTILFAPFSRLDDAIPVALWMVVARGGALLALAMAFRLAARLAGGGITGAIGGVLAALALLLLPDWLQFAGHGSEAPWAVALMLWAIERQLDGRRDHAFMLAALACLLRPELVPFLGVFAIWLWWAEPRLRLLLAGVAVVSAAAWLVPEWIGAGNPFDGAKQATGEPVWSLSHEERPWLAALGRAHDQAGLLVELLLLAAVAWALAARRVAPLVLAAVVAAEAALFAVMTQAGFSGNPRYVLPALTLACVLAGVGAARLLAVRPAAVGAAAGLALVVLAVPFVGKRVERMERELHKVGVRMDLHHDLAEAVDRVGGPPAVTALGTATANRAYHSHLVWELKVPISAVEAVSAHRLVFRSRVLSAGRVYTTGRARIRRTLLRVGHWRVVRRDRITFPLLQAQADRRSGLHQICRELTDRAGWVERAQPGRYGLATRRSRLGNTSASLRSSPRDSALRDAADCSAFEPGLDGATTTMTTVLAYLDPGSGSMILQIIAGGLAAVAVTAKLYWNRILKFLRIRKDEPETGKSDATQGTDTA